MLAIEELLHHQPLPGGVLLRGIPAADGREDHLIRQVMALANADLAENRCLVFGVEHGVGGTVAVVGLSDEDLARLETQRQACLDTIEPALDLALVTEQVSGQTVAALMIGNCSNPPYVAGEGAAAPLRAGECWLFDAQGLRPASRADLDGMYATRRHRRQPLAIVGIGEDPSCDFLEVKVPDAPNPPSRAATLKLQSAITAKKAAAAIIGRDDTGMARLAHARIFGADMPFRKRGLDTLVRALRAVPDDYLEADLHYRFEERAVQLNFSIRNCSAQALQGASLEFKLPVLKGLAVATRLYPGPGDVALDDPLYPEVHTGPDCIRVRYAMGEVAAGITAAVFATPLRLAVDRMLIGQKIAIYYSLAADGLEVPLRGRLRLRFRE